MKTASFTKAAAVLPIAAMLALTGCGGGGSGSQSNMMPPMTPEEMPPKRELSLGPGLSIGSSNPIYATTAAESRAAKLADPSNKLRAYSAALKRSTRVATATISDRFSITAVRGDGNYGLNVTYGDTEDTPTETEIDLPATLLDQNGTFAHDKMGYWLWALSAVPFNGMNYSSTDDGVLAFVGSNVPHAGRVFAVYGVETSKDALPTGTATYSGYGYAEMFDNSLGDTGTFTGRTRLNYDVTLNVDFADNSLTGRMDMTHIRRPGSNDREAFTGTGFSVTSGAIVDGQFTASLTGTNTNPDLTSADSMQGYEGNAVGAFYGFAGEAAGGVFTAERNMDGVHRVMLGTLWGAASDDN